MLKRLIWPSRRVEAKNRVESSNRMFFFFFFPTFFVASFFMRTANQSVKDGHVTPVRSSAGRSCPSASHAAKMRVTEAFPSTKWISKWTWEIVSAVALVMLWSVQTACSSQWRRVAFNACLIRWTCSCGRVIQHNFLLHTLSFTWIVSIFTK